MSNNSQTQNPKDMASTSALAQMKTLVLEDGIEVTNMAESNIVDERLLM